MDEAGAHQWLDILLNLRRTCEREGYTGEAVERLLKECLVFVRQDIMGEEVFRRALPQGPQGEGVLLLAHRFLKMEPLLAEAWPSDFTFQEMVEELFAIANGDEPTILKGKGKQGKSGNAAAQLERKMDAHLWYKVLRRLGVKASECQAIIEDCFTPMDTFRKWRGEAIKKHGLNYVEWFFLAGLQGKLLEAAMQPDPQDWARRQTKIAGDRYRRMMKAPA
jgi:hypothetical protein